MNGWTTEKVRFLSGISFLAVAVLMYAAGCAATGATTKTTAKSHLTGAELYQINCNRCHPERYPTEWTAGQWKTVMTHMRVRANLPADQAKAILKYLEEDSGK